MNITPIEITVADIFTGFQDKQEAGVVAYGGKKARQPYTDALFCQPIIPYQELKGNYNSQSRSIMKPIDYTIPRTERELQLMIVFRGAAAHYTIPRTERELQRAYWSGAQSPHYTIPRTERELQRERYKIYPLTYYTIPRTERELQPIAR